MTLAGWSNKFFSIASELRRHWLAGSLCASDDFRSPAGLAGRTFKLRLIDERHEFAQRCCRRRRPSGPEAGAEFKRGRRPTVMVGRAARGARPLGARWRRHMRACWPAGESGRARVCGRQTRPPIRRVLVDEPGASCRGARKIRPSGRAGERVGEICRRASRGSPQNGRESIIQIDLLYTKQPAGRHLNSATKCSPMAGPCRQPCRSPLARTWRPERRKLNGPQASGRAGRRVAWLEPRAGAPNAAALNGRGGRFCRPTSSGRC